MPALQTIVTADDGVKKHLLIESPTGADAAIDLTTGGWCKQSVWMEIMVPNARLTLRLDANDALLLRQAITELMEDK